MQNRWWFLSFYVILALFLIYELVFLSFVSQNEELKKLYINGFDFNPKSPNFNPSNYNSVFILPIIGVIISFLGWVSCIGTSRMFINRTPRFKLCFLILTFSILIIGFFITFAGMEFYSEWNSDSIMITPNGSSTAVKASHYYKSWLTSTMIWSIFGLFFAITVGCVILIIKLNFINIQLYNFGKKHPTVEIQDLELKMPGSNSSEFDPNENQTISITIEDDNKKSKK